MFSKTDTAALPVVAVIAAAGSGTRLGADQPKAFVELAGRTLVERALDGLASSGVVGRSFVMISPDMQGRMAEILDDPANQAAWAGMRVSTGTGGSERSDSVFAGLQLVEGELGSPVNCVECAQVDEAIVLVHDAARCLTPPAMIAQVVEQIRAHGEEGTAAGVVPTLPVTDTIKTVEDGTVTGTPARDGLVAVQTPQGFLFSALMDANRKYQAGLELGRGHARLATDDASIMELADYPVSITTGDDRAMKITTPRDFAIAEMMIER